MIAWFHTKCRTIYRTGKPTERDVRIRNKGYEGGQRKLCITWGELIVESFAKQPIESTFAGIWALWYDIF